MLFTVLLTAFPLGVRAPVSASAPIPSTGASSVFPIQIKRIILNSLVNIPNRYGEIIRVVKGHTVEIGHFQKNAFASLTGSIRHLGNRPPATGLLENQLTGGSSLERFFGITPNCRQIRRANQSHCQ